jgi:plasmid segregation protein ParM
VFESERHHHPYMRVLMNAAISLLAEEQDVFLATGLPLDFYKAQAKNSRQSLLGVQPELAWVSGPLAGEKRTMNISDALIFPQGAGAVFAALLDDNGNHIYPELMSPGTQIGLIDVGFRTTDYIVVEMKQGGAFVPKVELSGTIDVGVVELHRMVRQVYKQMTGGADLEDFYVDRIVHGGKINYKGKPILFQDHLQGGTQSISANITDRLKTVWGPALDLFDAIFLCGGGGELFHHALQLHFDQRLHRVPNGQFANVIGYMKLAKTCIGT